MPTRVEEPAPAKVNLTLHVTGRQADGYHLLDSLVVFADVGERVTAARSDGAATLSVSGPLRRSVPADGRNLILRAAALFEPTPRIAFSLWKTIPSAAGIGGGSSDAAAALRAVATLTGAVRPALPRIAALGADIPVCLSDCAQRMRGIGEHLDPAPALPPFALLLVNPGTAVPTGAVFEAMARRDNPPMAEQLPGWADLEGFAAWLAAQRNDMEPAARSLAPQISEVLAALAAAPGCRLARMSGSGATCFGLFASLAAAEAAAAPLRRRAGWWVAAAPVAGGAGDQVTRATT
ncbi:MAG: 4-(cytidine 5'-diphospho)-2-C-methyl-D-erythritol kinase [Pseudomonadota bacterium]